MVKSYIEKSKKGGYNAMLLIDNLVVGGVYRLKSYNTLRREYGVNKYGDILTTPRIDGRFSTVLGTNGHNVMLVEIYKSGSTAPVRVRVKLLDVAPYDEIYKASSYIFPLETLEDF